VGTPLKLAHWAAYVPHRPHFPYLLDNISPAAFSLADWKQYFRSKNMAGLLKRIKRSIADEFELWTGKRDALTPPTRLVTGVGGGDYKKVGEQFFQYFRELADLQPDARVLDVGCGCGRMAMPMLNYLSPRAGYWGFDITADNINWSRKNIQKKHPNFHFELADVYNKVYHPEGRFKASDYRFPYENEFFDFVCLTSVFSHMLPPDMKQYLAEIARVLKPGGRCLATYFILNDVSTGLMEKGMAKRVTFPYASQDCRLWKADFPEAAVGFEEEYLRDWHSRCMMNILEPIRYGNWSGRTPALSYQDMIISEKKRA
jgi:ubiquinone/menaquinone biosynthesis C-methylase UbiE